MQYRYGARFLLLTQGPVCAFKMLKEYLPLCAYNTALVWTIIRISKLSSAKIGFNPFLRFMLMVLATTGGNSVNCCFFAVALHQFRF